MLSPENHTSDCSARLGARMRGRHRKNGPRHPNGERKIQREDPLTPERRRRGIVELIEKPIADDAGRPSHPYRVIDTLGAMERRGSITAGMRQAGEDFRAHFATAQLDPLKAGDPGRPVISGRPQGDIGLRIEGARDAVWRAILIVGGPSSSAGSCVWHVVGWEQSLKEWALERGWSGRRVSQETASGILIAALGALEAYYGGARRR